MKKISLMVVFLLPFTVLWAQQEAPADATSTQQTTATNNQNANTTSNVAPAKNGAQSDDALTKSWRWTKKTAKQVGDNTSDAFKTGWGWTKRHAIGIGRGFKEGGVSLYKGVTGKDDPKSAPQKGNQAQSPSGTTNAETTNAGDATPTQPPQ